MAGGVSCFRFQNEYNKVEIALSGVQLGLKSNCQVARPRNGNVICNHKFDLRPKFHEITIINYSILLTTHITYYYILYHTIQLFKILYIRILVKNIKCFI